MTDPVNHPSHYKMGRVETIDVILDVTKHYPGEAAFLIGQVLKYAHRAPHKGAYAEDLRKAHWYLSKLVEIVGD